MSNAERQRKFRESHPGYYARIQAKKRAMGKLAVEQCLSRVQAEAAAKRAAEAATQQGP